MIDINYKILANYNKIKSMNLLNHIRALVVDDDPIFRTLMSEILAELGVEIIKKAGDGQKALALCKRSNENEKPFHIIISDIQMPTMCGISFLREIRNDLKTCNTPFIIVTDFSEKKMLLEAIELGINNYILKSYDKEKIKKRIIYAIGISQINNNK